MGQMTIRRLDDALLARLKEKAQLQKTSAEALARQAIHREAAMMTGQERVALAKEMQALTASLMIPGVRQTPAEELIRESRDFDH